MLLNTSNPEGKKSGITLLQIFLEVLRYHFGQLDDYTYTDDVKTSKISILPSFSTSEAEIGKRPAIYVRRGNVQFSDVALQNLLGVNNALGSSDYFRLQQGYMTMFCVALSPGVAETIAEITAEVLNALCLVLAQDYNFLRFRVEAIGEVGQVQEHKEAYTVPVTVTYVAPKVWSLIYESVVWKKLITNIQTTLYCPGKEEPLAVIKNYPPPLDAPAYSGDKNEIDLTHPLTPDGAQDIGIDNGRLPEEEQQDPCT